MVVRLNSLCKGHSGIHPDCIRQLVLYLNNNVHPAVPRIGSLGASGDLAPLSHLALTLIGEGEVLIDGEPVPTKKVLFDKGLVAVELTAKDGLSLINGTSQMTAYAAIAYQELSDCWCLRTSYLQRPWMLVRAAYPIKTRSSPSPASFRSNHGCTTLTHHSFRIWSSMATRTATVLKMPIHSVAHHKSTAPSMSRFNGWSRSSASS